MWLDVNYGPLVSEATTLHNWATPLCTTEPQPLHNWATTTLHNWATTNHCCQSSCTIQKSLIYKADIVALDHRRGGVVDQWAIL